MLSAQAAMPTAQETALQAAQPLAAYPAQPEDQSLRIQALQVAALEAWERDKCSTLELGHALIAVREAMEGHGDFAAWWRGAGMDENRVYYCIRLAQGKIVNKPALPKEPYHVNAKMLAVAKAICPQQDGHINVASVHLGPKGLTVTNGFVLARVGFTKNAQAQLPAGDGASVRGKFCANILSTMDRRAPVQIYAGKQQTKAVMLDGDLVAPVGKELQIDKINAMFDHVAAQPTVKSFSVSRDSLEKLVAVTTDKDVYIKVTDKYLSAWGFDIETNQRTDVAIGISDMVVE